MHAWAMQVLEMPASSQDQRKGDTGAGRSRRRELFKEEDVKLQWSTVRRAVSLQPSLHSNKSVDRQFSTSRSLSCMQRFTIHQDEVLHKMFAWPSFSGSSSVPFFPHMANLWEIQYLITALTGLIAQRLNADLGNTGLMISVWQSLGMQCGGTQTVPREA